MNESEAMSPLFLYAKRKVIVMAERPVHIDINQQIQDWKNARYGRQVRSANAEALTELQNQMNGAVDYLVEKGEAVDQATRDVQQVRQEAQGAVDHANEITEEYRQYADTKLAETAEQRQLAETAKRGADASASLSESWAHGGTGTRPGEDTNNSEYYSRQSKTQADRAKDEADRASQYSQITAPDFYLDVETGALYKKGGTGVDFAVADAILYWKIVA